MELNNEARKIIRFGSVLSILQAIAWSLMAVIAIGMFYDQPSIDLDENASFSRLISVLIYGRFLFNPKGLDRYIYDYMEIKGPQFHVFMWFYLILNLGWLINGSRLYSESKKSVHHPSTKISKKITFWTLNTFLICLLDFIFVCCLGGDYNRCHFDLRDENLIINGSFCYMVDGIVLTIAAKGFILWFLNIILAITIRNIGKNIRKIQQSFISRPQVIAYPVSPQVFHRNPSNLAQIALHPYTPDSQNFAEIAQQPNDYPQQLNSPNGSQQENNRYQQYPNYGQQNNYYGSQTNLRPSRPSNLLNRY